MLSSIQFKYFAQRGRECRTAAIRATDVEARQSLNDLAAAYECLCTETLPRGPFPNARLQAAAFAVLEAELPRDTAEGRSATSLTLLIPASGRSTGAMSDEKRARPKGE
jgi:hypothetical protein